MVNLTLLWNEDPESFSLTPIHTWFICYMSILGDPDPTSHLREGNLYQQ